MTWTKFLKTWALVLLISVIIIAVGFGLVVVLALLPPLLFIGLLLLILTGGFAAFIVNEFDDEDRY